MKVIYIKLWRKTLIDFGLIKDQTFICIKMFL